MKKTEILIGSLALISIVLRLLSIEGGALLSTITFGLLWLLYLFLSFLIFNDISLRSMFRKDAYEMKNWKRLIGSIVTGIFLSIAILGFLFKLNRWPGGAMMQVLGIIGLLLISVVSIIRYIPKPSKFYGGILIRASLLIVANVLLRLFW